MELFDIAITIDHKLLEFCRGVLDETKFVYSKLFGIDEKLLEFRGNWLAMSAELVGNGGSGQNLAEATTGGLGVFLRYRPQESIKNEVN